MLASAQCYLLQSIEKKLKKKVVPNGSKLSNMDSDRTKWSQVDPNGLKWIQMDSNGFRWIVG